jgi:hypothetical protein
MTETPEREKPDRRPVGLITGKVDDAYPQGLHCGG